MIELKNTPEHIELVKAMGSNNGQVASEAANAFADGIWPVIQLVLMQMGTASLIYTDYAFDEDTAPVIPLDFLHGEGQNIVQTWSAGIGGGLPTSEMYTSDEARVSYYNLQSAVSFRKKFARKSLLNILANSVERMINEILVKQELQAWAVIMKGNAQASTPVNGVATQHIVTAGTQGVLLLDDLSGLITKARRINHAYSDGTPVVPYSKGVTDLFVSPEVMAQIRAFAYNPMNTKVGVAAGTAGAGYAATAIPLPDAIREGIYRSAGTQEIFGINLTDLNELGTSGKYNTLFSLNATGNIAPGGGTFVNGTNQVLMGIDLTKKAFIRGVETNSDTGGTVTVQMDDQFPLRAERVGFWARVTEGRILCDSRATISLII
jgi:hypothetical protein